MNNINDIRPGKLKRKAKKSSTPSVVDFPGVNPQDSASSPSSSVSTGNLLGDVMMDSDPSVSGSLLDLSDTDSSFDELPEVSLKAPAEEPQTPASPLDQLLSDNADQAAAKEIDKTPVESIAPHRLQRKQNRTKNAPVEENTVDVVKLQDVLNQTKDCQQRCLDTLSRLQFTNVQNERRYAFILASSFAVLAILTIIGVFVGVNMKTDAKNTEAKYKQEACDDAVKYQKSLDEDNQKHRKAAESAASVYLKIKEGLYDEAVETYNAVSSELEHPTDKLLQEKIDDILAKLAENAYHDGVMLYKASNFEQARDAFAKSISYKDNTAYSPSLYYYLAMAYYQVGDFEGARRYFAMINSADLSSEMDALARFYRGVCAEKTGNEAEAYDYFDQFLKKYRYHRLADEATKHRAKMESAKR